MQWKNIKKNKGNKPNESLNSLKSRWVEEEWTNKFGEEVRKGTISVIPIVFGDIEEDSIPIILQGKNRINLSKDYDDQIEHLVYHLKKRRKEDFEKDLFDDDLKSMVKEALINKINNIDQDNMVSKLIDRVLKTLDKHNGLDIEQKIKFILREINGTFLTN